MYHKDTTRNLSFYHKDTPWIPKETMRYPRGTQWPMTLEGDLYIVILVEKEVSHYWKYGYQQYNEYSLTI
jgi:hypothetical protein